MDICRWRWNRAWSRESISSMFLSAPCMEERRLAFSLAREKAQPLAPTAFLPIACQTG
jgi:hypothetical protein